MYSGLTHLYGFLDPVPPEFIWGDFHPSRVFFSINKVSKLAFPRHNHIITSSENI
ncbi:hypothetical protein H8356DRAFT_1359477 [Neocallimastix lanati (nom. inval.)]|nr:hypothetical protein H8356DRAFT_1359477 [Neocallimastix sp. JGI-2020a]